MTYQYSYIIDSDPVDVYRTDADTPHDTGENSHLYIRIDGGGAIFGDYSSNGWVLNSCPPTNATFQGASG